MLRQLFLIATLWLPLACFGTIYDDLEDLQGKTVVYAGELEQLNCPVMGKYDCSTWPANLFKTMKGREVCFATTVYVSCSYRCKGLIAIGSDKRPFVFFFDRIGSDLTKVPLETYRCPSMY